MRKPKLNDFDNGDGTYDYEMYTDMLDSYADEMKDEYLERQYDIADQIHEERKSEKDEDE